MTMPATCSVCGGLSTRWIQSDQGMALFCKTCEPGKAAPEVARPTAQAVGEIISAFLDAMETWVEELIDYRGTDNPYHFSERKDELRREVAEQFTSLLLLASTGKPLDAICELLADRVGREIGEILARDKGGKTAFEAPITAEQAQAPLVPKKFNLPKLPARKPVRVPSPAPRRGALQVVRDSGPRYAGPTVACDVDFTSRENDNGFPQDCVVVTCSECDHSEQSWGHGERSVRRCLALMAENCPHDAKNFYVLSDENGED